MIYLSDGDWILLTPRTIFFLILRKQQTIFLMRL
jgi:hypothetical protein